MRGYKRKLFKKSTCFLGIILILLMTPSDIYALTTKNVSEEEEELLPKKTKKVEELNLLNQEDLEEALAQDNAMTIYNDNDIAVFSAVNVKGSDVVNIAKNQVGISGVPNIFTNFLGPINGSYSYSWCHAFVSWCAAQAGAESLVPKTARCIAGVKWFSDRSQWKSRTSGYVPQAGDIIYFDWGANGGYDHVGIVDYVSNGRVHTIEGNARNAVKIDGGYSNGYALSDPQIIGYGTPGYTSDTNDPIGAVDSLWGSINQIYLGGWTYDPDDVSKAVDVRIKIGSSTYTIKADSYRTGVSPNNYNGFSATINVNEIGTYTVEVYAVDVNNGKEVLIGLKSITIESQKSPVGHVDSIGGGEGYIGLSGWAYDPDNVSQSVTIKIQLEGSSSYTFSANQYRAGVAPTDYHGFATRVPVKESGTYNYEVYAVDIGKYTSNDTLIGSGSIVIGKKHFRYWLDTDTDYISQNVGAIAGLSGELFIQGWAVDSNGIDHVEYEVLASDDESAYVKGECTYRDRVDVQEAYPEYPKGKEGFMATIPYSQLRHGWYYPENIKIMLTAYCKGKKVHDIGTIDIKRQFAEKIAPTITNVKVTDISRSGYTVTANVADTSGIDRVQFPTWTEENGQDDIQKDWVISSTASGIISGNVVTYHVNTSDHNGDSGAYKTDIYAYDKYGNVTRTSLGTIQVPGHFKSWIDTDTDYITKNVGTISGLDGELFIQGWAIDIDGIECVEYEVLAMDQVSGGVQGTCTHRDRADVLNSHPGYAKGKEGFMATIPYSQLRYGWYYPEDMKIVLTAYCNGGQTHNIGTIEIKRKFEEKNAPKISSVKVTDLSYLGYTVTANVTDASGISRVQFPTWTEADGQDDIQKDWVISPAASGNISGNTVTYRVNVSDHNGEIGDYHTNIYVYDKYGNTAVVAVDMIQVPKNQNDSTDVSKTPEPSETPIDIPTVVPNDTPSDTPSTELKTPNKGTTLKSKDTAYKVTKKSLEIAYTKTSSKTENVTIPATIKINGVNYKITSVASNAFKGNNRISKVTIGKKITSIGKNAFSECKNLKTITIKSKNIKSVGKNAFKGINPKAKIKVPSSKLKTYKKLLKGKGQEKNVKITK